VIVVISGVAEDAAAGSVACSAAVTEQVELEAGPLTCSIAVVEVEMGAVIIASSAEVLEQVDSNTSSLQGGLAIQFPWVILTPRRAGRHL
jgi:hypothetical protein